MAQNKWSPKFNHPDLKIGWNIITVVFCLPFVVKHQGRVQSVYRRIGYSPALLDTFASLSSRDTMMQHHVVGWTGEIQYSEHGETHDPQAAITLNQSDRHIAEEKLCELADCRILPVWLYDKEDQSRNVQTFSDQTRWRRFGNHGIRAIVDEEQRSETSNDNHVFWWDDFHKMTKLFADRVEQIYQPGDIVWIHGENLCLLPALLRQRYPEMYIGFCMDAPFPSSQNTLFFSQRTDLLKGILGANFVSFQSLRHCRQFTSHFQGMPRFEPYLTGINANGAWTAVDVLPMGIDPVEAYSFAFHSFKVVESLQMLRKESQNRRIVIAKDNMNDIRSVYYTLQAFDAFLTLFPQWRGKISLMQLTTPTKDERDLEIKAIQGITELIDNINACYGSENYVPVQHWYKWVTRDEYFPALRAADVCLISGVGNVVDTLSLEYIICQERNHGPLILSEFCGAISNLEDGFIEIDPSKSVEVAHALNRALTMSAEERKTRHGRMYARLFKATPKLWQTRFLGGMLSSISQNKPAHQGLLNKHVLTSRYLKTNRRLLIFDYDGTLTPIIEKPEWAIPSPQLLRTLRTLANDRHNSVWIISGRSRKCLGNWFGYIENLGLSAEHGSFIRRPWAGIWDRLTDDMDMGWQDEVSSIFQEYTSLTPGSSIEYKEVAICWHYRAADPSLGAFQAEQCARHLERTVTQVYDVTVMRGKCVVEVRPTFANKGAVVCRILEELMPPIYGQMNSGVMQRVPRDFVLCMGDDETDEYMFRMLNNCESIDRDGLYTCSIGPLSKPTRAKFCVQTPEEVQDMLHALANAEEDQNVAAGAAADSTAAHTPQEDPSTATETAGVAQDSAAAGEHQDDQAGA